MTDYLPKFEGPFTAVASAAVIGGRVLVASGVGTVAHAADNTAAVLLAGVAAFDAASGERVTVYPLKGTVHRLTAGAAITAGSAIGTLPAGKVDDASSNKLGVALTAAAADGDVIEVIC